MEYDIREGEHDQLIHVLDEEIAITNTALERIEEQAAWNEDEDSSDLGDDYDLKYEHREDLRELRDLIAANRDGSGAVDVDEWQRSAIDQAREIIRQEAPTTGNVEQRQSAGPAAPTRRLASFPAHAAAAQRASGADRAMGADRLHYSPPSGLLMRGIER